MLAPAGTLEPAALAYRNLRKRLALWAYEWANLRGASCLHAHSEKEALGFRRLGLRNPVAVIPSAIPGEWVQTTGDAASFRRRFGIPQDRRVLLFLSRIHPIKGIALLLEALAATPDVGRPWLTVIAGPDEDGHLGRMKRLAQELALGQDVRFVGPLYGQDKRDAFAATELFVLPTHSESFGMVVAEALGAGVPVLTTHAAPWAELSTHGCGWQVEPSVAAIAQGLLDATRHSCAELADMGRRGRQLVRRRYTWSRVAEQTVALYEWLLDRRGRPDFVSLD